MSDKLFLNAIRLNGEFFPAWEGVPDDIWTDILEKYFFETSDSFGFSGVLEKEDLFPKGLDFFKDWKLIDQGLIEFENEIICRFDLNMDCKERLLKFDFAVHEKGFSTPRNYKEFDENHFYYEFDILYFFKQQNLIGYYINHENMIGFVNNAEFIHLLDNLKDKTREFIIESTELEKKMKNASS